MFSNLSLKISFKSVFKTSLFILITTFYASQIFADVGDLITSFGNEGIESTDFNAHLSDNAYAIATDGTSIYVAGSSANGSDDDFAVAKYVAATGELDEDFGTNGLVTTDFFSRDDRAYAIAINGDSIYVAGYCTTNTDEDFAIAKYDAESGDLDTSFGTGGKVTTSIGTSDDGASAITIQRDAIGTWLYVAGASNNGSTTTSYDFAVVKYNAESAEFDSRFNESNHSGIITTDIAGGDDFASAIIRDGSSLYVAGYGVNSNNNTDFVVVKYNTTTGELDEDFDGESGEDRNGIVRTEIGSANDLAYAIATNGTSLYVAGVTVNGSNYDFAVVKYDVDTGERDTRFGPNANGKVSTAVGSSNDGAFAIAIDDASVYVAGFSVNSNNNNDFAVVKYDSHGELVDSFADAGILTFGMNPNIGNDSARAAVYDQGALYIAGSCVDSTAQGVVNFCVAAIETQDDHDNDGYTETFGDCDDDSNTISPGDREICDGIDNDCDGRIDENFSRLGESCSVGVGACAEIGVYVCASGELTDECGATAGTPGAELCFDDIDNDCDGETDENDCTENPDINPSASTSGGGCGLGSSANPSASGILWAMSLAVVFGYRYKSKRA